MVYDHEGLAASKLKHPHHKTFHKTAVSDEDEAAGFVRSESPVLCFDRPSSPFLSQGLTIIIPLLPFRLDSTYVL